MTAAAIVVWLFVSPLGDGFFFIVPLAPFLTAHCNGHRAVNRGPSQ